MAQKMISLGSLLVVAALLVALAPAARAQALQPSSITVIDARTEIVSAKVNASGAAFEFRVTDAVLLKSLKVGQEVHANFTTKQVSLDGRVMCCVIISISPPPGNGGPMIEPGIKTLRNPSAVTIPLGTASGAAPAGNVAQAPTFGPVGGAYYAQDLQRGITIADSTNGAVIHYTTDGSTPTTSSAKYSGPILVSSATTIKAMATASGMTNSTLAIATYTILVPPPPTCPAGSVLEGVDVSHYQGTIEWKKVRASGRTFAYAKATAGINYVDPTFSQNYAAIKAAGLLRGAYHTFDATADPIAQADYFLSMVGTLQAGDLPPALDVETQGTLSVNRLQSEIGQWMTQVQAATGRTPIVYSYGSLLQQALGSSMSGDLLWIANYGVTCPTLPAGAQKWVFWQYNSGISITGSGTPSGPAPTGTQTTTLLSAAATVSAPAANPPTTVSGIQGQVDLNRFNGTLADLKALAKPSSSQQQTSSSTGPAPAVTKPVTPLAPAAEAGMAVGAIQNKLGSSAPNCTITAISTATGVVSAKENATGRAFEFKVTDAALLKSLKDGQGVYANFAANVVSLDGISPGATILSGTTPAASASTAATARAITTARIEENIQLGKCQQWMPQYGGKICRSTDPSKPAILLIHGLHQSAESWTKPSSAGYNYDHTHTPAEANLGSHSAPNAGLYKAGTSAMLDVDPLNWFDYLVKQGFTVAVWSQPCCNFAAAYPSAQQALTQFASDTAAMNPSAPPHIALVGHSRGGLVIDQLLHDQGNLGGRIRWAISIHTPHHGSQVAETPQVLADDASQLFAGVELPPEVKNPLKDLALQIVSPLNQMIDDGSKELAPQSSLITGLLNGDAPVSGVQYFTFGGTSPNLVRFYTWLFTPMSAVPQYKNLEQYFDWQAKPAEVGLVSPLLERVPAVVPEIKAGQGDSLVTDQSARLPYSIHETDQLNHAEVLWDRTLQQKVAAILSSGSPRIVAAKPSSPR